MMVRVARRYGMMILYLLGTAGAVAWAIWGLVVGDEGAVVFGFLIAVVFAPLAVISSPRGIERGYYRSVYRAVTLGRGRALGD